MRRVELTADTVDRALGAAGAAAGGVAEEGGSGEEGDETDDDDEAAFGAGVGGFDKSGCAAATSPTAAARRRCRCGHLLLPQQPGLGDLECSACGAVGGAGSYAGCRVCDYDVCRNCRNAAAGDDGDATFGEPLRAGMRVAHPEHGEGSLVGWIAGGREHGDASGLSRDGFACVEFDGPRGMHSLPLCDLAAAPAATPAPGAAPTGDDVVIEKPAAAGTGAICGIDLVLRDVVRDSPADRAGCRRAVGRRLTHIDGHPVGDLDDACARARGATTVAMTFA